MLSYRKKFRIIITQVLVFAFFFWYFLHYSFLRPCIDEKYDCILAVLLIIAMLVNFWVIYPVVHEKFPAYIYMTICLVEASIMCVIEYAMTYRFVTGVFSDSIQNFSVKTFLLPIYGNIFLRDLSLLLFVWLVSENINISDEQAEDNKVLFLANKQIIAKNHDKTCVVDVANIYLCRQDKNYTTLFSVDGERYKKRISSKEMEDLLRSDQFVRISRSDIIRLPAIKKCQDNQLTLKKEIVTNKDTFIIGKTYQESAIPEILKFLQQEQVSDTNSPVRRVHEHKAEIQPKATKIQRFISAHQDCKLDDIVSGTRIPKSTVTRYLKKMQKDRLVEYVGSKKTGGYRVVGKGRANSPANKR